MRATFSEVREELRAFHQFIGDITPEQAIELSDKTADSSEYLPEEGVLALDSLRASVLELPHKTVRRLAEMASADLDDDTVDHFGTPEGQAKIWAERHFNFAFFASFLPEDQQASL